MSFNKEKIDIRSRGEVSEYLQFLLKNGQIKDCECLKIEEGYLHAFYPKCTKDFTTRIPANNVDIDRSAGNAPSSYFWPKCSKDCPYYLKSKDFIRSLNSEVEEISNYKSIYEYYIDLSRIQELNNLKQKGNIQFDLTKLIEMCEELNICYSNRCFLAIGILVRSILDHVPPIFEKQSFSELANNYNGRSFKQLMMHLQNSSRKIADAFLHIPIRKKEALPTATQIDFRSELDVLLEEIVRILKT